MTLPVKVTVFPGGFNLPLWSGISQGLFAKRGLDIQMHFTPNSTTQLQGLISGEWDIGLTGFDNVVAYQESQGEAQLDREPDLFAFMGGDNAFLRLAVTSDARSYADLKGKVLSVDAMSTGFAFVLRKMLASNGLSEADVTFERAGGVVQRFEALKAGKHAGTLVLTPFDLLAEVSGLRVLQSASEVIPKYQGVCGVTRRGWAKENADTLIDFISGYLESLRWLFDPANLSDAVAILSEMVPQMTPGLAAATCEIFLSTDHGFDPIAKFDLEGARAVLKLRSEYGRPQKQLTNVHTYFDESYYRKAAV